MRWATIYLSCYNSVTGEFQAILVVTTIHGARYTLYSSMGVPMGGFNRLVLGCLAEGFPLSDSRIPIHRSLTRHSTILRDSVEGDTGACG